MKNTLIFLVSLLLYNCAGLPEYSFRGGNIPGETFSIESFANVASLINPNLAIVMQNKLQEKFTNESNLKYIVESGDANFKGVITKYSISPVQGTGDETASLSRLEIWVKVTYTNSLNNSQDFEKTFKSFEDFESTKDFSSEEDELMKIISEKLVVLIYGDTSTEW